MPTIAGMSRRLKARVAGVFYLLTFVTGIYALVVRGQSGAVAGLIAGACYLAVTLLFYDLFKPVNKTLSAVAAVVSLTGIAIGPLNNIFPGVIGEGALMVWLLVFGVKDPTASAPGMRT